MLNTRGGIECDFTVTRLEPERFRIVTGTAFGLHDLAWIREHAPEDGSVVVEDVTSRYACLGIWGPRSREILQPLSTADLSNEAFRYMRAREIDVGPVPCLALRVTYVGELGWELYCPMEFGLRLWDTIWDAGPRARPRRRRLQGDRLVPAREGLPRLGRRHHARTTRRTRPASSFAVKLDKGDFIGREALLARRSPSAGSPASSSRILAPSRSARSPSGSTERPWAA